MLRIKNKNTKIASLMLLPVYFLFLSHSMQNFHSHIFASGLIITHSNLDNCRSGAYPENEGKENEIIIFHGFIHDFQEEVPPVSVGQPRDCYVTAVVLFTEKECLSEYFELKKGRAPPALV